MDDGMMNTLFRDRPDPVGIHFKSTPGHGYITVDRRRLEAMPDVLKKVTRFYHGGYQFEEDVEWVRVALAFPHYFTDDRENARSILERYHPEIYREWVRQGEPTAERTDDVS